MVVSLQYLQLPLQMQLPLWLVEQLPRLVEGWAEASHQWMETPAQPKTPVDDLKVLNLLRYEF
jgi:hypothetical protein